MCATPRFMALSRLINSRIIQRPYASRPRSCLLKVRADANPVFFVADIPARPVFVDFTEDSSVVDDLHGYFSKKRKAAVFASFLSTLQHKDAFLAECGAFLEEHAGNLLDDGILPVMFGSLAAEVRKEELVHMTAEEVKDKCIACLQIKDHFSASGYARAAAFWALNDRGDPPFLCVNDVARDFKYAKSLVLRVE